MTKEISKQKTKKKLKINRIYSHYETWEDYHNGMYNEIKDENVMFRINESMLLLSTPLFLYDAMRAVLEKWENASDFNMSNLSCNRRAWLGQAACSLMIKATESEVRRAWGTLSEIERRAANDIASQVIIEYEKKYWRCKHEKGIED